MARPKKKNYSPEERLALLLGAGIAPASRHPKPEDSSEEDSLNIPEDRLQDRLRALLQFVRQPTSATDMLYFILYDISDNRVRTHIAKYLISKGCIRIQKSVYLARTKQQTFREINETLAEVQAAYDNEDSILMVPVQAATVGSMKIIGKDIQLSSIVDPPNTIFY
jgi:CRISPR-associated endonuclease Cas2